MKVLLVVVVALLVSEGTAEATLITGSERTPQLQRWVDRSRVPTPDETIRVEDRTCPESTSCTGPGRSIWLSPTDGRVAFMHEIGHHFDYAMSDAMRGKFLRLGGQWGRPWRDPPASPNECFADTYGFMATHAPNAHIRYSPGCQKDAYAHRDRVMKLLTNP